MDFLKQFEGVRLGEGVRWVCCDEFGVGALDKGAGVLSHPNKGGEEKGRVLVEGNYDFAEGAYVLGGGRKLYLLNRLDSATSGVILVSLNRELAGVLRELFLKKTVRKVYVAMVFGGPSEREQVWRDRLEVVKKGGVIRTGRGGNVAAESRMRVLRQWTEGGRKFSLVELEPRTGRSHQLRVQCSERGLPIVGDATYGDFRANREFAKVRGTKRLFLHSLETGFDYEWKGRRVRFKARVEVPAEWGVF